MSEQETAVDPATDSGEPEAPADDAIDVAEVADVDETSAEEPEAEVTAEEPEAAAPDEDGGDDPPARDPEALAAIDEVTDHATKLGDAPGVVKSPFRTPPGIPSGLDPGTPEERG